MKPQPKTILDFWLERIEHELEEYKDESYRSQERLLELYSRLVTAKHLGTLARELRRPVHFGPG